MNGNTLNSDLVAEWRCYLVSVELVPPGKHLGAVFTFVGQHPRVERSLVYLEVGLGGEGFITEPALVVPPALVDDLHMSLELEPGGQQLAAYITREQLLGDSLPFGIYTVLSRP